MNVLDTFQLAPGCCYFCRARQEVQTDEGARPGLILDTGREIDFEGRIYICEGCVIEFGHHFGMASEAEASGLRASVAEVEAERDAALADLQATADALDALRRYDAVVSVAAEVVAGPGESDGDAAPPASEGDADGAGDEPKGKKAKKADKK